MFSIVLPTGFWLLIRAERDRLALSGESGGAMQVLVVFFFVVVALAYTLSFGALVLGWWNFERPDSPESRTSVIELLLVGSFFLAGSLVLVITVLFGPSWLSYF